MSHLHKVKEWFSRLLKPRVIYVPIADSHAEYNGPDLRFYTENYKIGPEDKKKLVQLVQKEEFRILEKYFDWRVNAAAHRMKALLIEGKDAEARSEAAAIDALVKITQDMQNYWTEVKLMDVEKEILVKAKSKKRPKAFGEDAVSLV